MTLDLQEVARAMAAAGEAAALPVGGLECGHPDTAAGDVYFALRGANRDGPRFCGLSGAGARRGGRGSGKPRERRPGRQNAGAWRTRWWRPRNTGSVGAAEVGRDVIGGDGQCGQDHYQGPPIAHLLEVARPVGGRWEI